MVDKKTDQVDVNNWMSDLKKADIKKIAQLNIIPTLKVEPIDNRGNFEVLTVKVKTLPKLTEFADGNWYFVMMVEQNEMVYQMVCSARSFRQNLAVIIEKHFDGDSDLLIGRKLNITKVIADIDTSNFKGKAEVYQITLV